jgi:hypothetical protein
VDHGQHCTLLVVFVQGVWAGTRSSGAAGSRGSQGPCVGLFESVLPRGLASRGVFVFAVAAPPVSPVRP